MTKLARVIIIFVSIFFLLFAAKNSYAQILIRPIPDQQSNIYPSPITNPPAGGLPITDFPSVTFGDLLNKGEQPINTSGAEAIAAKTRAIKELLAQLETSSQQSKIELQEFYKKSRISNFQFPISNSPSPTPYIPVPTLIAGISEIVNSQTTDNRQQITDNRQQITVSRTNLTNLSNLTNTGTLIQNPIKTTYTLAVLGDSMVDTLGRDLPHLRQLLSENFPKLTFALLNYGQGATDLESGLYRLTNTTTYLGETFAPLLSFKPDILVVESFAYNHWSAEKYDLDRQWLTIAKIIDTVKENSPDTKIILAATIAPNSDIFGNGSLNWPENLKWESSQIIKAYLQNLVNFAISQNYPLADAYHPSLGIDGKGLTRYINGGDNLHPSGDGGLLFSQKIVEAIKENNLLK